MFRLSAILAFIGLVALPALAQPPGPGDSGPSRIIATTPLVNTLLGSVQSEGFAKDLGLSAEQVKKLVDYRTKQQDEFNKTPADVYARGAAERTKALTALFQEVLTPEQYKRAVGLAASRVWSTGFRSRVAFGGDPTVTSGLPDTSRVEVMTLAQYPEIAAALSLTDDQKKMLVEDYVAVSPPNRPVIFLTPEQSKAAQDFMGKPAANSWDGPRPSDDREFDIGFNPFNSQPPLLTLTGARDVRTDVGISDEQTKSLDAIRAKWSTYTTEFRTLSPEARTKKREALTQETNQVLAQVLKPEQMTRLTQINRQVNRVGGVGVSLIQQNATPLPILLRYARVRLDLGFTPEQQKSITAADQTLTDTITKTVNADGPIPDMMKAIEAAGKVRDQAYLAVLTDVQRKALEAYHGEAFTGSTSNDPRVNSARESDFARTLRVNSFGNSAILELRLLALNKTIQDELKLTAEQIKQAEKATADYSAKFRMQGADPTRLPSADEAAKARKEQTEFIQKSVTTILTADQAKRYRELMIQRAEGIVSSSAGRGSTPSVGAAGVPGVAEAIKLTEDQKTKLLDGGNPAKVLTTEQKTAIQTMAGKPYTGTFSTIPVQGGRGSFGLTGATTAQVVLTVPWEVFQITPDQATRLVPVVNRYQMERMPVLVARPPVEAGGAAGPGGGGLPGARRQQDPEKLAAADAQLTKALTETLKPEQLKRIEQVRHQMLGLPTRRFETRAPYFHADIAKALALTPEQLTKIQAIDAETLGLRTAITTELNAAASRPLMVKIDERVQAQVTAVLTAEQQAKWKDLVGDPVPNLGSRLPFGFGGRF